MVVFYGNSLSLELVSSILYLHIAALYCILLHIYGFVAAKMKLDPNDVFSSEWSDELLFGRKGENDFDGCGLEGECVCSEHRHCSPTNGYFCQSGLVYKEARVCRYSPSSLTWLVVVLVSLTIFEVYICWLNESCRPCGMLHISDANLLISATYFLLMIFDGC